MKFEVLLDSERDETITARVRKRTALIDEIERLVLTHTGADRIPAFTEDETILLPSTEIECLTVSGDKTFAVTTQGEQLLIKLRLYEAEQLLPGSFIRINKSAIANTAKIRKFTSTISGAVNCVFQSGYTDYVSRRCFQEIKRRLKG